MIFHQPVLLDQVIKVLDPSSQKVFLDATLGHGGHTISLLKSGATVFGLDADFDNLKLATNRITDLKLQSKFHPLCGNFKSIKKIFSANIKTPLDGLLLDLGLTSHQLSQEGRGFSFNDTTSLDMRLDPHSQKISAENIINTYSEDDLFDIFSKISQEKLSRPLAQLIVRSRQVHRLKTGQHLADLIRSFYQKRHINTRLDPATKIFMALRIVVNQEFENLNKAMTASLSIVKSGGVVAIISFHSGEDRLVKSFIRRHALKTQRFLPTPDEVSQNPLSRSAVLRTYTIS